MQQQQQHREEDRAHAVGELTVLPLGADPAQFVERIDPNKHALSRPCCIGEFSLDRTRRQQPGRSRVRYFNERTLGSTLRGANLGENFHTFVPKVVDAGQIGIEQLLQWIMAMATPNSLLRKTVHECGDFVLWRGTMTRLSTSPYDDLNAAFDVGVKVACTKHRGVYFVNELETVAKQRSENSRSDHQQRQCYAGFKFEQLVTVDDDDDEQMPTATTRAGTKKQKHGVAKSVATPVDQNNEFVGIFKATLMSSCAGGSGGAADEPGPAPLRLLYGAEIDCISPTYGEFMEIKTQHKSIGHGKGFANKALKWWLQSYLIGIKQLVVGTHERLVLNRVELFPVASLPNLAASACWSGPVCLEFLLHFLHYVRRALDAAPAGAILLAERRPTARAFEFRLIGPQDAGAQGEHRVLSEAFKDYPWR